MSSYNPQKGIESLMEQEHVNQIQYDAQLATKNNICKKYMHSVCDTPNCRFLHDLSKAIPCKNYVSSGFCAKGNLCNYLHQTTNDPQQPKPSSILCKQFKTTGYCSEGNQCLYKHSKIICKDFSNGFCIKGKECQDLHQQSIPC